MHRARPTEAAGLGCGVVGVQGASRIRPRLVGVGAGALEAERFGQELVAGTAMALEGTDASESLQGELLRDLGMPRDKRSVGGWSGDELETKTFRIFEKEAATLGL